MRYRHETINEEGEAGRQRQRIRARFGVTADVAENVRVGLTLATGGDVKAGYEFSADSSFLLYLADQEVDERVELFRVDLAAPGVATKTPPVDTSSDNPV